MVSGSLSPQGSAIRVSKGRAFRSVGSSSSINGTPYGDPVELINGSAELDLDGTLPILPVGYAIDADFLPDDQNFEASTSQLPATLLVQALPTIRLTSSAASALFGQSVTFSASVSTSSPTLPAPRPAW